MINENPTKPLASNICSTNHSNDNHHMKLSYRYLVSKGMYLFWFLFIVTIVNQLFNSFSLTNLCFHCENLLVFISLSTVVLTLFYYLTRKRCPVYLVNFSCYKPQDSSKWTKKVFIDTCSVVGFSDECIEFQQKVLDRSGIGEETYLPEVLLSGRLPRFEDAIKASKAFMCGTVDKLFAKTGVHVKDIGILIVNSSLFNPLPSLSTMIVNLYKLCSNTIIYNLGGMGCSAGLISIDLAKSLLQVHKNCYALIVSVEEGTWASYRGNERSMLISNCLFRNGGAAILLSNKKSERHRSKYELIHTVRTHRGADNTSFTCVMQKQDSKGNIGISLYKELMNVAGDALKANITTLGPLVLPFSEQFLVLVTLIRKKFDKKLKVYVPDFKLAFEHFCIHAGGKAIIDGVQKNLMLSDWHIEPSRMTLHRFGNTSSTSVWYELAYTEAKGRVNKGDRIWQIAFGSGFKCNSAVWRALRTVNSSQEKNPWMDEIHLFPVKV